jgi:hypothetical protein
VKIKRLKFVYLLTLVLITLSACSPSTPISPEQPRNKELLSPVFRTSPIEVSPEWLFVGDNATIKVEITNVGKGNGSYTAVLKVDGKQSQEKTAIIAENQTSSIGFLITKSDIGYTTISIGESKKTIYFSEKYPYEIRYDNYGEEYISIEGKGKMNAGFTSIMYEPYGQMVRFTIPAKPFLITKIALIGSLSMITTVDKEREFTINLRSIDGKKLWFGNYPWSLFGAGIVYIDVPNIPVDDDFYVEFISHTPPNMAGDFLNYGKESYLGLAFGISDFATRSGNSKYGQWVEQISNAGVYKQYAIRVSGFGGAIKVLSYDDAKADAYNESGNYSYRVNFSAPYYPFDLSVIQLYGYRNLREVNSCTINLKVVDKETRQILLQQPVPLEDIRFSSINSGVWNNLYTDRVACSGDFIVEITCNQQNATVIMGCDTSEINRNSEMSVNGESIVWKEWDKLLGPNKMRFTQDNTKWMIRAVGVAK